MGNQLLSKSAVTMVSLLLHRELAKILIAIISLFSVSAYGVFIYKGNIQIHLLTRIFPSISEYLCKGVFSMSPIYDNKKNIFMECLCIDLIINTKLRMRKTIIATTSMLFLFFSCPNFAAENCLPSNCENAATDAPLNVSEHEALSDELINLLGAQDQIEESLAAVKQSVTTSFNSTRNDAILTEELKSIIDNYQARVVNLYEESLSWSALRPVYLNAYQGEMNVVEMKAAIDFLNSPSGQKLMDSQRQVSVIINQIVENRMRSASIQIESLNKQLKQKLSEIGPNIAN